MGTTSSGRKVQRHTKLQSQCQTIGTKLMYPHSDIERCVDALFAKRRHVNKGASHMTYILPFTDKLEYQ